MFEKFEDLGALYFWTGMVEFRISTLADARPGENQQRNYIQYYDPRQIDLISDKQKRDHRHADGAADTIEHA